jgi:PAS domain S-box-containing protein
MEKRSTEPEVGRDATARPRGPGADAVLRLVDDVKGLGVFTLNADGRVATWSAGAQRLCGYPPEDVLGTDFGRFYVPEDVDAGALRQALVHAERDGRFEEEGWRVRKDGSRFWASVAIAAWRDADGKIAGYGGVACDRTDHLRALASVADVSERQRADRERDDLLRQLRTLNAELEQRVESRTAELRATLKEREVLLQEVHHRVKNNLQVISSLINLQLRTLGRDASRGALEDCRTRVQAIALIHEKLYQSEDYAEVPFSAYARGLATDIFHATGVSPENVTLDLAVEDVALAVDKAIPCGLILNELMTNALKHAFPGGREGTIRVEVATVEGGGLRLVVGDDGVGLAPGLDVHGSPSLGLQLVRMLAKQLDADLQVETGPGARFRVTVPGTRS